MEIQVERAQKASQGLNLISSKATVNMIMYVQIDSLKYRFCWMNTRPSHTLCRPLGQVSKLHVILSGWDTRINEPHSSVLPGPSEAYSEKSVKAANMYGHYEKVGTSPLSHILLVRWLIKRPISHPCLTSTYQLILH